MEQHSISGNGETGVKLSTSTQRLMVSGKGKLLLISKENFCLRVCATVPEALDVWMQRNNNATRIVWRVSPQTFNIFPLNYGTFSSCHRLKIGFFEFIFCRFFSLLSVQIPLANQSGGEILDYTVALTKASERGQQNTTTVPRTNNFLMLTLDPAEEYTVTVTARNINGSSSPATIPIPTPGMM